MRSSWTIALSVVLVVVIVCAWSVYRGKTLALQRSADAERLRARAEQGDEKAQFTLGRMYADGKQVGQSYPLAIVWYTKSAEQGYAKAQSNLGQMYFRGQGVGKNYNEALKWIQRAADQSDAKAEASLGFMYYYGEGESRDYAEAARWYRKAAEQGESVAQQGLAYMYYNGVGLPQDYAEAGVWYQKAAEQGDIIAQERLGFMYANGQGVPIDRNQAIAWYRKAANQGDAKAKHTLESIEHSGLMGTRNFELLTALIGFPVGLWLSLGFLLRGRKRRYGRQTALAVLGLVFLGDAGLSLYAFHDGISYWLHKDVFDIARWLLNTAAILLVVTVVLRPKKEAG